MFPVDIAKFLRTGFFYRIPPVAASDSPTTVHGQCVCVLWFRVSLWFSFWSKTYTKRYTNNSLLSHDKIIFSLIERAFNFRICFAKILVAFDFDGKFTQYLVNITYLVSKDFLSLLFAVDQFWDMICIQFQDMIWKTEECGVNRNIELKIWW